MMKYILSFLLFFSFSVQGQSDKKILKKLKQEVEFLADDKLEGRRTGTAGEKLAAEHISQLFEANGLVPKGDSNQYFQNFRVVEGLKLGDKNRMSINNESLQLGVDYSPLAYAANASVDLAVSSDEIMLFDLKSKKDESGPHVDFENEVYESCLAIAKTHALKLLVLFNSGENGLPISFDSKSKKERLSVPVVFINKEKAKLFSGNEAENAKVSFQCEVVENVRNGINVVGMLDNGAAQTIVIGAHFDHLGYGEDHNSLYAGNEPQIHHGADDNASGTSALISLSELLKDKGNKKYNYLCIAFSGEELGLFGSKYFVEHPTVPLSSVRYMINMDMIGRLNDSSNAITVGGFGTSPTWGKLIRMNEQGFTIKVDSSGSGPSDHTSFYKKNIPVLFFFTGTHSDYHKPSDLPEKINYRGMLRIVNLIRYVISASTDEEMVFTKTREVSMGKSAFKVTMGIMPDYTFSGDGVLVEGVSENKPAKKAGILAGDVIMQLGENRFSDVQGYMKALNKFNKGETTNVKLKRGEQILELSITF
jgi:Zn-dependent M28 family amino/carboxypeptidase